MKMKIWGARGSIPAPLAPQTVREKIIAAFLSMAEIEQEQLREKLLSAILAQSEFAGAGTESDEARQKRQLKRRKVVEDYLNDLSPLAGSTAGSNTPCIEVREDDTLFIIDAGSGIRSLGLELMQGPWGKGQGTIHLFFSHPHWDHIQGFPFFRPAFVPGNQIHIYSIHDIETALRRQQEKISFPVPLDYMAATIKFNRIKPGEVCEIDDVRVRNIRNFHPGDSYSFRFEKGEKAFVYASDASYPEGTDLRPYLNFFADADLLIFDSQFTQKESDEKEDWGHSSSFFGVEMAQRSNVKTLLLYHYDPTYSDEDLEKILADTLKFQENQYPSSPPVNVLIAQEGQVFDLTPVKKTQVQQVPGSKAAILKPTGIFDEHVAIELRGQFFDMVDKDRPAYLIIDMSGVEMLQVAGLRALVKLRNDQHGIPMALAEPSPNVQQLIELAGYLDFFAIYPSVHAALNALRSRETLNLPGQTLKDRYRIDYKIGEGRLGTVFKATDMEQNVPVAIKILSPSFSDGAIEKFLRQARQIIELIHPNIADVYDCDVDRGISFMAEEYLEGRTLRDLIDDYPSRPLPFETVLSIVDNIAQALEYAHAVDVVHGDLKPKNVLLANGGIKISDFGLGRLESGRPLVNINVPLALVTARYLAPEQVLGHPIDARTDLYALGVILYEMLTGQSPFKGSDQEVLEQQLNKLPAPPREINPKIPLMLDHLILRLLEKDPNKRYGTARQVRSILNSISLNGSGEIERQKYNHEQWPALVGRQKELQILFELWAKTRQGQGQVVLLNGGAGLGKTRLIREFVASLDDTTVLMGTCQKLEGSPPYYPFIGAVKSYFNNTLAEEIESHTGQVWTELVQLIPEAGQIVPDVPLPPFEDSTTRTSLATLTDSIAEATTRRPWLLVLDEIQWIDQASLKLLKYLAHRAEHVSLMLVGIYENDSIETSESLADAFTKLDSQANCTRLSLEPLTQAETTALLENIWSQSVPVDISATIYDRSLGNPLFIEQIAQGLADEELINWQAGRWNFVPIDPEQLSLNLDHAIRRRFARLNRETQTLLNQAAILGEEFTFGNLAEMSTLSVEDALGCLDTALERQLLEEGIGEQRLRFSHTQIQETIYRQLNSMKRRMLHQEAGEALERRQLHMKEVANQLAYHFLQAGELERGLAHSIRAATHASIIYANQTALFWYSRALEVMDDLSDERSVQYRSFEILMAREQIYNNLGRRSAQLADLVALQKLAQALKEPAKQALIHNRRSAFEQISSHLSEALSEAQAGLIAAQQSGNLLVESKSLLQMAQLAIHQGHFEQARQHLRIILDKLKRTNNQQDEAEIINSLGTVQKLMGNYSECSTYYQQALAMSQLVGDRQGQATYLSNLAEVLLIKGDYDRAEWYQKQALLLNQMIGKSQGEALCLNRLARIYKAVGQYDLALDNIKSARNLHRIIEDGQGEAADLQTLGAIYALQSSDYVTARDYIGQALELAQYSKNKVLEVDTWLEFGLALEGLQDYEKACNAFEQMRAIQKKTKYQRGSLDAEAGLARCLVQEGKLPEAQQKIEIVFNQLALANEAWPVKYPAHLYLSAHHIFSQVGDPQKAADALDRGHTWLQRRSEKINNLEWRASFLENIADHQKLTKLVTHHAKATTAN
ncbi:MAG: protein kinase [Anaerolineales bacterium]|nr:protein kinase [Anaerolineales bacterium]